MLCFSLPPTECALNQRTPQANANPQAKKLTSANTSPAACDSSVPGLGQGLVPERVSQLHKPRRSQQPQRCCPFRLRAEGRALRDPGRKGGQLYNLKIARACPTYLGGVCAKTRATGKCVASLEANLKGYPQEPHLLLAQSLWPAGLFTG